MHTCILRRTFRDKRPCVDFFIQFTVTLCSVSSGPRIVCAQKMRNSSMEPVIALRIKIIHNFFFMFYLDKISFNNWFTIPGFAFPFAAFMVWPTRKPMAFSLPLW